MTNPIGSAPVAAVVNRLQLTRACVLLAMVMLSACQSNASSAAADTGERPDDLEDVVTRNTIALGGETALDSVTTMVKRSLIVEGQYRDIAVFATDRQGRMRVDLFADGERVFAESYDSGSAFQWSPKDGQSPASADGTVAMSHTPQLPNHIFRLKDVAANGHSLELIDRENLDGVAYSILKLTLSDGFESFLWVDAQSGFVTRVRNERALHVDLDSEEKIIESRISEFRSVHDLVHPHRVVEVDLKSGETLAETTVLSVQLNVELPKGYFRDLVRIIPEIEMQ